MTDILEKLNSLEALARLALDGAEPLGTTPAEFGAHIRNELDKWPRAARAASIEPQ